MILTILAYKDTELDKFQPAFLVPQQLEECIESIFDAAKKGKIEDVAHKQAFYFGTFDTLDGKFALCEKKMVADLTSYGVKNA